MDFKNVQVPDPIELPKKVNKGKNILNTKALQEWFSKRSTGNFRFRAEKGIVEDIYYDDGSPVEGNVNIAWVDTITQERFDLVWGYEDDKRNS